MMMIIRLIIHLYTGWSNPFGRFTFRRENQILISKQQPVDCCSVNYYEKDFLLQILCPATNIVPIL
jgi:hypothetical protein